MSDMIKLPESFKERMKEELGNEYQAFIRSYEEERTYGLRVNPLKCDPDKFVSLMPFSLKPVPWAYEGYYYDGEERPGKHVYHEAGAYYIQEPSAMSAVSLLDPKSGEKVLDLCAAPGGKSTQIAGRLMGEGLLVSNEVEPGRARILSQNIERMGVRNCVVTNESVGHLRERFVGFFDRILVDAPCSGEGMFRKDETAIQEWSSENVEMCAKRQAGILDDAAAMLKPGGILVYSTCTFSKAENEDNIEDFLKRHEEFSLEKSERLSPHKVKGEGHFVAHLKKSESFCVTFDTSYDSDVVSGKKSVKNKKDRLSSAYRSSKELTEFLVSEAGLKEECVDGLFEGCRITVFGDNYYLTPEAFGDLSGLNIVRPGLHIATDLKKRLEPAHALAMSLRRDEVNKAVDMDLVTSVKYLSGETIACNPDLKGWSVVFADSFSVGFGKATGGVLKNHYPKGLRVNL